MDRHAARGDNEMARSFDPPGGPAREGARDAADQPGLGSPITAQPWLVL